MCSTWPNTTRTTTSGTGLVSSGSLLFPLRRAGPSVNTPRNCFWPSNLHLCLSLLLKVQKTHLMLDRLFCKMTYNRHLACFLCRSRPFPVGVFVPSAERQSWGLPGVAWLARVGPRSLRAQRGGEGVCACSGNSNIQRHKGPLEFLRGAPNSRGEQGLLLLQSSASEGSRRVTQHLLQYNIDLTHHCPFTNISIAFTSHIRFGFIYLQMDAAAPRHTLHAQAPRMKKEYIKNSYFEGCIHTERKSGPKWIWSDHMTTDDIYIWCSC